MRPPRLAVALVRVLADPEDRDFLLADLEDRHRSIAASEGAARAWRWYWSQAVRSVPWALGAATARVRRSSYDGVLGEARIGLRSLARRPLYTIGVAGTLALGLGAATVVYAVAWAVWLSPMPMPDPGRVVRVFETEAPGLTAVADETTTDPRRWSISPPLLEDLRARRWRTLEAVAGLTPNGYDWAVEGGTSRVSALTVSPELFSILGVAPSAGRLPSELGPPEVIVTERFWERRLGADPGVVGSLDMMLDGRAHRVTGVVRLPAGYPADVDVLDLFRFTEDDLTEGMRGARYLEVVARVLAEHDVGEARAEVDAFVRALGEAHPQHRGWGGDVAVLADELVRPFRGVIALLLAAGTTFLLLAAVNVAGLVAARRAESRTDRSIRLALGASEGRLLRGAVIEGLTLAGLGTAVALVLSTWLLGPIRALVPTDVPRFAAIDLTPSLLLLTVAVGATVGLAVGASGYAASRGAKPSAGRAPTARAPSTARRAVLVVGQVALTTLLTAGGVAILHNALTLRGIDVGFDPEGVSTSTMVLSAERYPSPETRRTAWEALLEGLERRGATAALGFNTPMSGSNMPFGVRVEGEEEQIFAQYHGVSSRYFDVLGIPLLEGRAFGAGDLATSEPVVVVSRSFASQHLPAGAVGAVIDVVGTPRTVVGVVGSTRHHGPDAAVQPEVYVPLAQDSWAFATLAVVGAPGERDALVASVLSDVDPQLVLPPLTPYETVLRAWFDPLRLQLSMIACLAGLGLVLASLGLYSLLAYHVSTRTAELGVRRALGAPRARILSTVVARGGWMALMGVGLGLLVWYRVVPSARGLVDGIDGAGWLVPLVVPVVIGLSCLLASLAPALRATRVDPMVTLKTD